MTFKALHSKAPHHQNDMLIPYEPQLNLRSLSGSLPVIPPTRFVTKGDQSFSVHAPKLWNSLPAHHGQANSVEALRYLLITHF